MRSRSMEKHIQLVGILNIVYRSIVLLGGLFLLFLAAAFWHIFGYLVEIGAIQPHEIPRELLNLVPLILACVALLVMVVSTVGIIAAAAVLRRKEWGRILLLVVSFFNLIRIPLGTILAIYSIWVLLNGDAIKQFTPLKKSAPAP
jgi:uncharacterized protein with PQ loop repeat